MNNDEMNNVMGETYEQPAIHELGEFSQVTMGGQPNDSADGESFYI